MDVQVHSASQCHTTAVNQVVDEHHAMCYSSKGTAPLLVDSVAFLWKGEVAEGVGLVHN